jgi:hypothetical protein
MKCQRLQLVMIGMLAYIGETTGHASPFGNSFGMQLRPAPTEAKAVWAPAIVREAPTNECSVITRRDGTLELYGVTKPKSNSVSVSRSRDGGLTWSNPEIAFQLPGQAYYAVAVLEASDGTRHAVYHVRGDGPGGYQGRLYDVYHTRRASDATEWSEPRRVVPGYVGSINGFIQLARTGRLLLAVARAVPERERPPVSGPDRGWNDTFVYFSDDQGATWRQSPDQLDLVLAVPNVTRYGAIEPTLLELRDGRIWMLVRDRGGRLWETFSLDGERWPALTRSAFVSSDSPADLFRLRNGKIILVTNACQNWSNPHSYAMGGREVLHAAVSADEGGTWRGFREILHETNVVSRGDRGTSYASVAETNDGKVVVVSGQGEGKRAILMLDPRWLEEVGTRDELKFGPVTWTQYGGDGLHVEQADDGTRSVAIPMKTNHLNGASWNFPIADAGELTLRIRVPSEAGAVRLALNDHFTRVDDTKAFEHAVYVVNLESASPGAVERWRSVRLRWSDATRGGNLFVEIDGRSIGPITAQRAAQIGVNYFSVAFRASGNQGELLMADLQSTTQ